MEYVPRVCVCAALHGPCIISSVVPFFRRWYVCDVMRVRIFAWDIVGFAVSGMQIVFHLGRFFFVLVLYAYFLQTVIVMWIYATHYTQRPGRNVRLRAGVFRIIATKTGRSPHGLVACAHAKSHLSG